MVYNEGYGGAQGLPKPANSKEPSKWWRPHFEREEVAAAQETTAAAGRGAKAGKGTAATAEFDVIDVWRTPDNTVFTHENEVVREFFELGGYRAFPDVVSGRAAKPTRAWAVFMFLTSFASPTRTHSPQPSLRACVVRACARAGKATKSTCRPFGPY